MACAASGWTLTDFDHATLEEKPATTPALWPRAMPGGVHGISKG
eukprot:CAMPEP_0179139222 /NCGR_PEP_ID=MMETSP0796-20121207/66568_1 /TAXON_ID=73915 /ORGANISM="Pyrodinium bahamense, Strain pbaha01" /LENGTH=43 /DNA_ID= /DNA_START= /DNA_END= /DNA_ORIENTATION=